MLYALACTRLDIAEKEEKEPMIYQIKIKGHLDRRWTEWFGGLTITLEDNGETVLTCLVADQAALHGLLRKVRDLDLPLISVTRAQTDQIDGPDFKQPIEASTLERKQDGVN
jgi:hypothetical protein